jgi:hypothetical protein
MTPEASMPEPAVGLHPTPRDDANWAKPVARLVAPAAPPEAINLNVEGRRVVGPLQGFGQLWQKTYRLRLEGCRVTPAQLIAEWAERRASHERLPDAGARALVPRAYPASLSSRPHGSMRQPDSASHPTAPSPGAIRARHLLCARAREHRAARGPRSLRPARGRIVPPTRAQAG